MAYLSVMLNITSLLIAGALLSAPATTEVVVDDPCVCVDYDGDGFVGRADLQVFLQGYGAQPGSASFAQSDLNCDGISSIADYLLFIAYYGSQAPC